MSTIQTLSEKEPLSHQGAKLAKIGAKVMHMTQPLLLMACFSSPGWCGESRLQGHPSGIWSIAGTRNEHRWLVIHNLDQGATTGVYHIEVLGRDRGQPVWSIKHLANHMAITEKALSGSIVKPLSTGAVYPESFDDAYRHWQSQDSGAGGPICRTAVPQCLRHIP